MKATASSDLDFLGARIHGRRSRLAEADRLDALCRIRTVAELARAVFPDAGPMTATDLQRRMVLAVVAEVEDLAGRLSGPAAQLLQWTALRFQMENLKVLARAFAAGMSPAETRPHVIPLPGRLAMRIDPFLAADSVEAFADLIPSPVLSACVLRLAAEPYRLHPRPFFIEAALDHGYLTELLRIAGTVASPDRGAILSLAEHEACAFNVMLVARGKFNYRVPAETLARFFVKACGMTRDALTGMLAAADLADVAARAVGHAIDAIPASLLGSGDSGRRADPSALESPATNRFYRLANRAFRRSHMGVAAVIAYTAIRRVELANLITLSEGIRAELPPETIRGHLIPRGEGEARRV